MINVAIMGHGTVGSGVAEILINEQDRIADAAKEQINVKYILDLRKFDGLPYSEKFIDDFNIIAEDDEIKIVIEVMGGINPAFDFVKKCLQKGKSVVTSNKELVATKGAELIKIAKQNNANFLFEASVGGGIPILRPLVTCLSANEITEIKGILNGTTNYILNKMIVDGMDFDEALKLAQKNGFAEKNPSGASRRRRVVIGIGGLEDLFETVLSGFRQAYGALAGPLHKTEFPVRTEHGREAGGPAVPEKGDGRQGLQVQDT